MVMIKEEIPKPLLLEDLGMVFATENSKKKVRFGLYKCSLCGTEFKANTNDINRGYIKSCGCYQKRRASETHKTHGLSNTRLNSIWRNIKGRTLNPNYTYFHDYGGRGITLCNEWLDIHNFYNWAMENGYSNKLSIDRIDNDGNYEPSNCRWTTRIIQARNRRVGKLNKSGYKGVSCNKDNNKYITQICVNKKRVNLGSYPTTVEGAIAYNNYIIENNLEGFILNEIPDKKEIKEK